MDLQELKNRFAKKSTADVRDVDIALKATPFLVREVIRLESELEHALGRLTFLTDQMKKKLPPTSRRGQRGGAAWEIRIEEKYNLLICKLVGLFDYRAAKAASNQVVYIIPNLQDGCNLIFDLSGVAPDSDRRLVFHLRKVMHHIRLIGIKRVISVGDVPMEGLAAVLEERAGQGGYQVFTAKTIENAMGAVVNADRFLKQ